ncbi:hypothetical protein BELL_0135g00190 [Botrytis elliptica]|uniref:Xylanolytic transcriptional activator regulatory domain-containing protein n=1 Tax=Botrytis elliptica TaxID=278938 RepID=A0A4Z1K666_9HELO|nr:hypothetical protein EAE99_005837 [Botrytis elliptica]TGO76827.1 hypothetical protein BELL_0135g00190 [Botrytis elliptica]
MIPTSNATNLGPHSPHNDSHRSKRRRVDDEGSPAREVGLMRTGFDQSKPRFIGSGSGIHFIRTVYELLAGKSNSTHINLNTATPASENIVPGEDDQLSESTDNSHLLASSPPFFRENEVGDSSQLSSDPISFHQLVEFSESYFTNWHPLFPFLHAPAVLGIFEAISRHGIQAVAPSDALIVRSIISISLADSRQSTKRLPQVPRHLIFYNNAELGSTFQLTMALPATFENLQATISLELFLISMLKFNYASRLGGLAVRMAYALGCHRCPARYDGFTPTESQLRRRVFWSLYCMERMVSQSLGLPLDLRDDDIDVCYPGEEKHLRSGTDKLNLEESNVHQLRLLVDLSKHSRIRGRVLELRNKSLSGREETFERAMEMQVELAKWVNEVSEDDEDSLEAENSPSLSPAQKLIIQILQHESTIALNRPLITSNLTNTYSQSALQNCIGASRAIISLLREFQRNNASPDGSLALKVPMVWPLFTWSAWMSCFVLAYAALEGHCKLGPAKKYAKETLLILEHLSLRQTVWPDSCADAVKQLSHALDRSHQASSAIVGSNRPNQGTFISNSRHAAETQHRNEASSQSNNRTSTLDEACYNSHSIRTDISRPQNSSESQRRIPQTPISFPRPFSVQQASTFSQAPTSERNQENEWDQLDLYQGGLFDPLIAMDFSNFATGTTDPTTSFGIR